MTIEQIKMLLSDLHEGVAALERVHAGHTPHHWLGWPRHDRLGARIPHAEARGDTRRSLPSLRSLRLCVRYFSPPLGAGNHAEAAHSKVPEEQCTLARSGAESLARVRVRPRAVDIYSWNSRTVGTVGQ